MHCCLLWHLAICVHVLFFRTFVIDRGGSWRKTEFKWKDEMTLFILCSMLVPVVIMECQQIKNKLHSCDRFVRTSEKYSDLMEMTFDDEEEDFLVTFFLANQPPKVTLDDHTTSCESLSYDAQKNILSLTLNCHWKVGIKYRQSMGEMIFLVLILF